MFCSKKTLVIFCGTIRMLSGLVPNPGNSLVICGPSGVGKGTIISYILSKYPKMSLSVSHTSRHPRPGEVDGFHYHFSNVAEMEENIKPSKKKFIEFTRVHQNIYGTSHEAVKRVHRDDKICVLDVDTRGVRQLKDCGFPAKYVFIRPPSVASLEMRLRDRGTETEAQMQVRLTKAPEEILFGNSDNFDSILVNDDLTTCNYELESLLVKWFPNLTSQYVAK